MGNYTCPRGDDIDLVCGIRVLLDLGVPVWKGRRQQLPVRVRYLLLERSALPSDAYSYAVINYTSALLVDAKNRFSGAGATAEHVRLLTAWLKRTGPPRLSSGQH